MLVLFQRQGINESTLFCPHWRDSATTRAQNSPSRPAVRSSISIWIPWKTVGPLQPQGAPRTRFAPEDERLADTALLNDAYRTLEDPLRREYLLKLKGARVRRQRQQKPRRRRKTAPSRARPICSKVLELDVQLKRCAWPEDGRTDAGETDPQLLADLQ